MANHWVNWFLNSLAHLPKCYNFDEHDMISKDIGNAHN